MIKFFQKLKAKKGFTLVELIVVIAIIGVLAAILVPTMLGYVTSSRVTSANSTASSLKNNIDTFLTNADTAGYGMKLSKTCIAELEIDVIGGVWTADISGAPAKITASSSYGVDAFKEGNSLTWAGSKGTAKSSKVACGTAEELLATELQALFPEIKDAAIVCYLQGGKALYLCYTADTNDLDDLTNANLPQTDDFEAETFEWDNQTAGVSSDGYIIGTAPALTLKTA